MTKTFTLTDAAQALLASYLELGHEGDASAVAQSAPWEDFVDKSYPEPKDDDLWDDMVKERDRAWDAALKELADAGFNLDLWY